MYLDSLCRVIYANSQTLMGFWGFLAVLIISSCKMAATVRKADYHFMSYG